MQQQHSLDWSFLDNGALYDRDIEQEKLFAAYNKRLSLESCNEFILLSGKSGTGKTALAQTIRRRVTSQGGFFITGKFDQLQKLEPYAALVSAFTEYVTAIVNGPNENDLKQVKEDIRASLFTDLHLVIDMIPALEKLFGFQQVSSTMKGADATLRLHMATRNLVRAITSPSKPLVLFLDDLQWADSGTLNLLRVLASDKNCHGLVLMGACRYEEVEFEDEFAEFLRTIETKDKATIVPIVLHNLTFEAVEELVSDVLHISKEESRPIFRALYRKTKGNIFFVIQALESLYKNNFLTRDFDGRWQWDTGELKAWGKGVHNVMDLMLNKIQCLSSDVQTVVITASCLGAEFDERSLAEIVTVFDVSAAIDEIVVNGLVVQLPGGRSYRFVHDRVQQAAYSLLPDEKLAGMHFKIGQTLRKNLSEEEVESNIFLIVDQIGRGSSCLNDQNEKDELASLCLRAGHKAKRCSDFKAAAEYYTLGIESLSDRNWRDQYYLSLDLYSAVAEAKYCVGEFDVMDKYINEVLANATSLRHKVPAYSTKIYALGARHRVKEAVETGFALLTALGEKIPLKASRPQVMMDVAKTMYMLRDKSDEDIMNQPPMCDPDKIAAMSILNLLSLYVWLSKMELFPFIACRMVRLTTKYGPCAVSSYGFGCFAVLMGGMKRIDDANRFSTTSIKILESYNIREWVPRVYLVAYGIISCWFKPIRDSDELLHHAVKVGLETGDLEFSMGSAQTLINHSFVVGKPLEEQKKRADPLVKLMGEYKQDHILAMAAPATQTIHNLLGLSEDPCVLTGKIMDQDKLFEDCKKGNNQAGILQSSFWRMVLAYFMNDYTLAVEMAKKSRPYLKRPGLVAFVLRFYTGLASLALLHELPKQRRKHRRKHLSNAKSALQFFQQVSRYCPSNVMNKIFLLEAELAVLRDKLNLAVPLYQRSIELAESEGFLHEQALANERAGLALRNFGNCGDEAGSERFLREAYRLYGKWGSRPKMDLMSNNFPFLLKEV